MENAGFYTFFFKSLLQSWIESHLHAGRCRTVSPDFPGQVTITSLLTQLPRPRL